MCAAPACSPVELGRRDLHHLGEVRSHILLCQEPQCRQPGVGSWKEALSQDHGLKCPLGLSARLPHSAGHIAQTLGPAGSQRASGILRPPYPDPLALAVHNHYFWVDGRVFLGWVSRPAVVSGSWARPDSWESQH